MKQKTVNSKQSKIKKEMSSMERLVMEKIQKKEVKMKPKWYFVAGGVLSVIGLAGIFTLSVFLINIITFILKRQGPACQWKITQMIAGIPLWIPVAAILGLITGILMLKKYDFSYKRNFMLIAVGVISVLIITALAVEASGVNELWSQTKTMRRFYQKIQNNSGSFSDNYPTGKMEREQRYNNGNHFYKGRQ